MIPLIGALVSASQTIIVTLNGASITYASGGGGSEVGIRFTESGIIQKKEGGVYTQIGDWLTPNGIGGAAFDIRFTGLTGDAFTTEAAAEDAWVDLSTNREWLLYEVGGGILFNTVTFEIRTGSTTFDTGSYSFTADDT